MAKQKTVNDLIHQVEKDPELKRQLQEDPVKVLRELNFTNPVYTRDKVIYRLVVGGFIAVLLCGMIYFIFQYQYTVNRRADYCEKIIEAIKVIPSSDIKEKLMPYITPPSNINGTTPQESIIAVFTGIIGALAGLLAPSPLSRSNNNNGSGES